MSQKTISPGDIVQLKSGGPEMTVEWIDEQVAMCAWFDGKKNYKEQFQLTSLR